ncbi:hypothetical protein SAMN05444161_8792 [Rhizobiales bacterium GAS191]|nr:hypothetical protein SAMN05444161_8792 [Rhizobiales bacterium GAS191]
MQVTFIHRDGLLELVVLEFGIDEQVMVAGVGLVLYAGRRNARAR